MAKIKIDVEDLVTWALVRQCAKVDEGRLSDEFRLLSGGNTSATGAVEAFLTLGTRVDGGGANDRRTPADALTVAMAIDALPVEAAALVVMASKGQAIDWAEEGVGYWVAVKDRRGNHKKLWQDPNHARGLLGWGWRFEGHLPSEVDHMRMQYVAWWHALVDLRVVLDGRLQGWDITGPRRAAEPWNQAPARVLHPIDKKGIDVE